MGKIVGLTFPPKADKPVEEKKPVETKNSKGEKADAE